MLLQTQISSFFFIEASMDSSIYFGLIWSIFCTFSESEVVIIAGICVIFEFESLLLQVSRLVWFFVFDFAKIVLFFVLWYFVLVLCLFRTTQEILISLFLISLWVIFVRKGILYMQLLWALCKFLFWNHIHDMYVVYVASAIYCYLWVCSYDDVVAVRLCSLCLNFFLYACCFVWWFCFVFLCLIQSAQEF